VWLHHFTNQAFYKVNLFLFWILLKAEIQHVTILCAKVYNAEKYGQCFVLLLNENFSILVPNTSTVTVSHFSTSVPFGWCNEDYEIIAFFLFVTQNSKVPLSENSYAKLHATLLLDSLNSGGPHFHFFL
jgi:hypothetical protein